MCLPLPFRMSSDSYWGCEKTALNEQGTKPRQRYPVTPQAKFNMFGLPSGPWASARCRLPGIFRISSEFLLSFGGVRTFTRTSCFGCAVSLNAPSWICFGAAVKMLTLVTGEGGGERYRRGCLNRGGLERVYYISSITEASQ